MLVHTSEPVSAPLFPHVSTAFPLCLWTLDLAAIPIQNQDPQASHGRLM